MYRALKSDMPVRVSLSIRDCEPMVGFHAVIVATKARYSGRSADDRFELDQFGGDDAKETAAICGGRRELS